MRSLRLTRETLTELTGPELASVVGGTHLTCGATDTCGHGGSIDAACPTTPVANCLSANATCPTLGSPRTCFDPTD